MALIVLMEDDLTTVTLITAVLKKSGHQVLSADNGRDGLALVRLHRPHLVVSDVQMPHMDGLQMLAALRQEPDIAATPVVLLTFLDDRADMRRAMVTGADDYITKPFRYKELLDAVTAQLDRSEAKAQSQLRAVDEAVKTALADQTEHLMAKYEQRLVSELSDRWLGTAGDCADELLPNATVLFVDICSYAALAEVLTGEELTNTIKNFYVNASDTVHLFGATHLQFVGDGLLVIFTDHTHTAPVTHSLRACRAATGLVDAARRVQAFLQQRFADRVLPEFAVNVALHVGEVSMVRLDDPLHGTSMPLLPVGDAVSATLLLQKQARLLGWQIAASGPVLRGVPQMAKTGARAVVHLPGRRAQLDAAEFLGLGA